MTLNIYRYDLDQEKAISYVVDRLIGANTLSDILNNLDFKSGKFFTLLPIEADLGRIYAFTLGGILIQNPIQEYNSEGGHFSWTPTIKRELSLMLYELIKKNSSLSCLFEDVIRSPFMPNADFFHQYGLTLAEEVYYYIDSFKATEQNLLEAIDKSNAFWHQLFIVFESKDFFVEKVLALEVLENACKKIQLLVVGAYDAEGFVFWEPDNVITPFGTQ